MEKSVGWLDFGRRFKCFFLATLAFAAYSPSMFAEYPYDDEVAVQRNKDINSTTPILELFSNDFWGMPISSNESHKSYRPLTVLTYRINRYASGGELDSFQLHLTNILLHSLTSVLSLSFFETMLVDAGGELSFLCSLVFAVHPVHSEPVCALVGRADILSGMFFFASFLVYHQAAEKASFRMGLLCILLSYVSALFKETGITVLGVCSAYDILVYCAIEPTKIIKYMRGSESPRRNNYKAILARHLLLAAGCAVFMFLRLRLMGETMSPFKRRDNPAAFAESVLTRTLTYNYVYFINLWIMIWPQWLCYDWAFGCIPLVESFFDARCLCVVIFYAGLARITWSALFSNAGHEDRRRKAMALVMLIVPFLPASNVFFTVGFVVAERVLYLPLCGFAMLLAIGLQEIEPSNERSVSMKRLAVVVLFSSYFGRSIDRSLDWMIPEELCRSSIRVCPLNAKMFYNYGSIRAIAGDYAGAIGFYTRGIELEPDYPDAKNSMGLLYLKLEQPEKAEVLFRQAVADKEDFLPGMSNLASLCAKQKRFDEAEKLYKDILGFRKKLRDSTYFQLGMVYVNSSRIELALEAFANATEFNSEHFEAWKNRLVFLIERGNYTEAVRIGESALKNLSDRADIHFNLGNAHQKLEDYVQAAKYYSRAIELNPEKAIAHLNLGFANLLLKNYHAAKAPLEKAYQLNPNLTVAKENLEILKDYT